MEKMKLVHRCYIKQIQYILQRSGYILSNIQYNPLQADQALYKECAKSRPFTGSVYILATKVY